MPKLTLVARLTDGLPLAASMEEEKDHRELDAYKASERLPHRCWPWARPLSSGRLSPAGADQTVEPPAFEAPEFAPPQPPAGPGQEDRQAAERDFARAHDGAAAAIALLATARVGPICPPATPQIESGQNSFHYIHLEGVCFLCLAERSYPKRLAFRCPQGLGSLAVGYPTETAPETEGGAMEGVGAPTGT